MEKSITVIIPAYNAEGTIERCIRSLLNQNYQNYELLIVDDGSTDETYNICKKYAMQNKNIIKVVTKENGGVSSARNYALDLVSTEYLVFVDSDDFVDSGYLRSFMDAVTLYPNSGHIWCGFKTIDKDSDKVNEHLVSDEEPYSLFDRNEYMQLYSLWFTQMPWHRLFITKILLENGIRFDESLSLGEDLLFNLHYLDASNQTSIVIVNSACYNYVRTENDSLDHKYRSDLLQIYQKLDTTIFKYLKKWNVDDLSWDKYYNSVFFHYEHILKNTFHSHNSDSFIAKLKYNNTLLKSDEFKSVLSKRSCYVHPVYMFSYAHSNYLIIYLWEHLYKAKSKIKKH